MVLLEVEGIRKVYRSPDGGEDQVVLDVPQFSLAEATEVAIAGTSGSGKTTFLNVIAGLTKPDAGTVTFDGKLVSKMGEAARDRWRANEVGYMFQTFNLLEGYTALENVMLGMMFGKGADRAFARQLLETLGLGNRLDHRPSQMSIGQQQRVALARALASRPRLVLADEPTGNLDPHYAMEALELLRGLCREHGAALLCISHDERVLEAFDTRQEFADINVRMKKEGAA